MKAIGLVVVNKGMAEVFAPPHVQVEVVDLDCIATGEGPVVLPRDMGFDELAKRAELKEGTDYEMERPRRKAPAKTRRS